MFDISQQWFNPEITEVRITTTEEAMLFCGRCTNVPEGLNWDGAQESIHSIPSKVEWAKNW